MNQTTIAAISTAPGTGGIGIIRISGTESQRILFDVFRPSRPIDLPVSHMMMHGHAIDENGIMIDECLAVIMKAPRSYTGEDVAEIHLHGSSYVLQKVLLRCIDAGALPAGPG